MTEWQPIETAPTDGTEVLLTGGEFDVYYDVIAHSPAWVVGWFEPSCFEGEPGDWRFCSYDSGSYGFYHAPTHWMPLPEPPAP